jgi:thioglycine synthase
VTRVADISLLDKLHMPNYSAVLPGTEDTIWVYGGKGQTRSDARASALMEAIERYSSFHSSHPERFIRGTHEELSKSYKKVLHPAEVAEPVLSQYDHDRTILEYLLGLDILTNEEVLVPAELALYKYTPKGPINSVFMYSHTNGLASGNVIEESICHALCELIERDAVSIAELCASSIPYNILETIKNIGQSLTDLDEFVDDSTIFPDVDIISDSNVKKFSDAGISLLIKDITQTDIGIPTFIASSIECITHDYGYYAIGSGAHPDALIALTRAITEVSQTRAANIQGARDDLKKIQYKENDDTFRRKWQFMPSSIVSERSNTVKFSDIESFRNNDILDDINLIRQGLKKAGLKRAIIVDLTHPGIGIPVVRAIVPGLETFDVTRSIMGTRAKRFFRNYTIH